jgi:hypothetical protein
MAPWSPGDARRRNERHHRTSHAVTWTTFEPVLVRERFDAAELADVVGHERAAER